MIVDGVIVLFASKGNETPPDKVATGNSKPMVAVRWINSRELVDPLGAVVSSQPAEPSAVRLPEVSPIHHSHLAGAAFGGYTFAAELRDAHPAHTYHLFPPSSFPGGICGSDEYQTTVNRYWFRPVVTVPLPTVK